MTKKKAFSKSLIWEKIYPLVLTLGFLVTYSLNKKHCFLAIDLQKLIELSLNLFGVLLGFLITVLTVINSLDNIYTRKLREKESFFFLMNYLKLAIRTNVYMLIFAILYLTIDLDKNWLNIFFEYLAVFIFGLTLFSTYRFIDIFLYIVNTEKNN